MSLQLPFALSLALAAIAFALLGRVVVGPLEMRARMPLVFTSVLIGQMLAWLGSYLVLPWNAVLGRASGFALPLSLLIWCTAIGASEWCRRRGLAGSDALRAVRSRAPVALWIVAAGAGALGQAGLVWSGHLGALGLDTHQHIYWVNQILDADHLPLVARHTEILATYPRGFHLLVALWTAAGLSELSGPMVKWMPFAQTMLPCLALVEALVARAALAGAHAEGEQTRDAPDAAPVGRLALGLVALLLGVAFIATNMVYPSYDLSGTPRYASSAVLACPILLAIFGRGFGLAVLERAALLTLPAAAGLLLAANAVVALQLVLFVVPVLACLGAFRPGLWRDVPGRRRAGLVALSLLPAVLVSLSDAWLISIWTPAVGSLGDAYLSLLGVVTRDQAIALGLISPMEFVADATPVPRHAGLPALIALGFESVWRAALGWLAESGAHFPFLGDLLVERWRAPIRIVLGVAALAAFASALRARRSPDRAGHAADAERKLFLGLVVGTGLGALLQIAGWQFVSGLAEGRGYTFVLLREYTAECAKHVSLFALAFLLLACAAWLHALLPRASVGRALERPALAIVVALALLVLPGRLYRIHPAADGAKGFWTWVGREDIEALRRIEAGIPESEGVMVSASAWDIGQETWIIPRGATASVLPFARRRYVFNASLGYGVGISWRDLNRFCRASDRVKAEFIRRNDLHWILVKARDSGSRAFYEKFRFCHESFESLGVAYPAAATEGDLSLYRITGPWSGFRSDAE